MRAARDSFALLACFAMGLILALGSFPATSRPAPSFVPVGDYTSPYSRSITFGDLNGDGKPELIEAAAPFEWGRLSIFRNSAAGRFEPSADYETAGSSYSSAIGDLNGDGKPDVVTANTKFTAGSVSVFLNRGDGTFQAHVDYQTGDGTHSVVVGDLNGDGKPDLATANLYEDTVSVLVNVGDGTFGQRVDYPAGVGPHAVVAGDLNGDGRTDLAAADYGGYPTWEKTVSVLINNGAGFDAPRQYTVRFGPESIAIGDLNGDGHPDLATANTLADSVSVLQNTGDGTFAGRRDYAVGRGPKQVVVGDLDGDGRLDLATANYYPSVPISVLLNKGDGSFYTRLDYPAGGSPQSIAVGDVNGDGRPDLATANGGYVRVQLQTAGPHCTVPDLSRKTRPAAQQLLVRANCRVGRIRWTYSSVPKGRVTGQTKIAGKVFPYRTKVGLRVSRGSP